MSEFKTKSLKFGNQGTGSKFVLNQHSDGTNLPWFTLDVIIDSGAGSYTTNNLFIDPFKLSKDINDAAIKIQNK